MIEMMAYSMPSNCKKSFLQKPGQSGSGANGSAGQDWLIEMQYMTASGITYRKVRQSSNQMQCRHPKTLQSKMLSS
jgi:hypothetical protein